jgi:hypothetical protein
MYLQERKDLCTKVMQEIDAYVERYDIRGEGIARAASDVCDGWVSRWEIDPLLSGRRLTLEGKPEGFDSVCGNLWNYWTVSLTRREIEKRYPGRLAERDAPVNKGFRKVALMSCSARTTSTKTTRGSAKSA